MALTQVQQTAYDNIIVYLNDVPELSPDIVLTMLNETLHSIYPWNYWQVAALPSNSSTEDFYSSCRSCLSVSSGPFLIEAAWLPADSPASINQDAAA